MMTVSSIELDDDLFARPPRATLRIPALCQIVCVVCGLQAKIAVGAPAKLCLACASDLVMTKSSILARLEALARRAMEVHDAWQATEAQSDALERWQKAHAAGVEPPKAFAKSWAARRTEDTPLARLLCAWEVMQAECAEIERQRAAEQKGLEEVERANG